MPFFRYRVYKFLKREMGDAVNLANVLKTNTASIQVSLILKSDKTKYQAKSGPEHRWRTCARGKDFSQVSTHTGSIVWKIGHRGAGHRSCRNNENEGGTRCVFDFELIALAAVLKVDVRWLLGIDERPLENGSEVLGSGKLR